MKRAVYRLEWRWRTRSNDVLHDPGLWICWRGTATLQYLLVCMWSNQPSFVRKLEFSPFTNHRANKHCTYPLFSSLTLLLFLSSYFRLLQGIWDVLIHFIFFNFNLNSFASIILRQVRYYHSGSPVPMYFLYLPTLVNKIANRELPDLSPLFTFSHFNSPCHFFFPVRLVHVRRLKTGQWA